MNSNFAIEGLIEGSFLRRRQILKYGVGVLALGSMIQEQACAAPQSPLEHWPTKPIKLVVPFAPGGGNDTVARAVGDRLSGVLGQKIIIDNRGGGGTINGSLAWLKGKPLLGGVLGAICGPVSYGAGIQMGAGTWGSGNQTWQFLAVGLIWGLAIPLFLGWEESANRKFLAQNT